jgi:hypothetical protein
MASTYSTRLRLELMASGDQSGTWGATTNTNLGTLIEAAIAGHASVTPSSDADYTLIFNNGAADEARSMIVTLNTGPWTMARSIIVQPVSKLYVFRNNSTYAATVKVAGTGVTVASGTTAILWCDGVNVYDAHTQLTANRINMATSSLGIYNSSGNKVASIDSSGNLIALGNITAYGTP